MQLDQGSRGGGEGREVTRKSVRDPVAVGRTLAFALSEVEARDDSEKRRDLI